MSVQRLNKTKNTLRNITTGIVGKLMDLLLPFIVRTLFLQKFGVEYLGLRWKLVTKPSHPDDLQKRSVFDINPQ